MCKRISKNIRFIVVLFVFSGVSLAAWDYISFVYLHLITFLGNPVWAVLDYSVKMTIQAGSLHFVYQNITAEPLSFTVNRVEDIYLNIVVIISLFGASFFTIKKDILKALLVSAVTLLIIHEILLFAYSYTNIWIFLESQGQTMKNSLEPAVSANFPKSTSDFFSTVIFHYNSWGWNAFPLVLWFIGVQKELTSKISAFKINKI